MHCTSEPTRDVGQCSARPIDNFWVYQPRCKVRWNPHVFLKSHPRVPALGFLLVKSWRWLAIHIMGCLSSNFGMIIDDHQHQLWIHINLIWHSMPFHAMIASHLQGWFWASPSTPAAAASLGSWRAESSRTSCRRRLGTRLGTWETSVAEINVLRCFNGKMWV